MNDHDDLGFAAQKEYYERAREEAIDDFLFEMELDRAKEEDRAVFE